MSETWDEMEARHALERQEKVEQLLRDAEIGRLNEMSERETHGEAKGGIRRITRQVASSHGVSEAAILGKTRNPRALSARFEAYWRAKEAGYSYPQIGYAMARHHTTIMSGVEAHKKRAGIKESAE